MNLEIDASAFNRRSLVVSSDLVVMIPAMNEKVGVSDCSSLMKQLVTAGYMLQ